MDRIDLEKMLKSIKKERNLDILVSSYQGLCYEFSCKPNKEKYPYPQIGEIIDEDKSVRWNREEVERLRLEYEEKATDLILFRNKLIGECENRIITLLGKDYEISYSESQRIWDHAYGLNHSYGIQAVINTYNSLADMYTDLLKIRNNKE